MTARLLFFAQAAQWARRRELDVSVSAGETVRGLVSRCPELGAIGEHSGALQVAVNEEFESFDSEVRDGDEIAFLPPVSGG